MIKQILVAAALAFGVSAANAATIGNVTAKTGVAQLVGSGSASADGSGFFITGVGLLGPDFVPVANFSNFSADATVFLPFNSLAAGAPDDTNSGAGFFEALYTATPIVGHTGIFAEFDLFLLRVGITAPDDPFAVTSSTNYPGSVFSVTAVEEVNPIPLPASLPLLLAGLSGVALFGRRRKTVGSV